MIHFSHVSKSFGSHKVLDDLDLHIPKHSVTFIVGKSGEGKSVTIKHIMGLIRPDHGVIEVDGEEITDFNHEELREHRKKFGMLFQQAALFDSMTVGENVAFPLQEHSNLSRISILEHVADVLDKVGLPDVQHRYPNQLSTGEKKRVGLARALIGQPKVLLYDEPTTGMDPLISEMIDQLIIDTAKNFPELTSVVISHDLKAALATAGLVIMLYKGRVALEGPPEVFRCSDNPIVRQFFAGRVEGPMEFL